MRMLTTYFCIMAFSLPCSASSDSSSNNEDRGDEQIPRAESVRVTTLSTMMTDWPWLTDALRGEWGYAALVEIGDTKILFDTGRDPDVIEHNVKALGIDLADVDSVVLSHHHDDHTGGLAKLKSIFPSGLNKVYVAEGFAAKDTLNVEQAYMDAGGSAAFEVVTGPTEIAGLPYAKLTGNISRAFEERKASNLSVPDDQALVIDTVEGLVIITGCGHAGVINTIRAAEAMFPGRPIHALIGGLHLYEHTPSFGVGDSLVDYLEVVARKLSGEYVATDQPNHGSGDAVKYLLASHCSGVEPLFYLRNSVMAGEVRRALIDTPATRFVVGSAFYNSGDRRVPMFNSDVAIDSLVDGINPVSLNRPNDWPAPPGE